VQAELDQPLGLQLECGQVWHSSQRFRRQSSRLSTAANVTHSR
jgi:hypothetical protein